MKEFNTIYATLLFLIFTPGLLFTISKKLKKEYIAIIHAILFALFFHITRTLLWDYLAIYESLEVGEPTKTYNPNPNSANPNGPPYATVCNVTTVGQMGIDGICKYVGNYYKWVTPCDYQHVNAKNYDGKTCVNQGNGKYNWI